jgi:hypothetical protein
VSARTGETTFRAPRARLRRKEPAGHATAGGAAPVLRTLTLSAHLASSRAALASVALVLLGIFLPALVVPYAFSDDYPILSVADGLGSSPWFGSNVVATVAASGRPLAGALDQVVIGAAGTIDNLRFVRLLGVAGIVALACLLHWALVRAGFTRLLAALATVLACSTPAFLVYGSWAVLFNAPWAALLGAGASMLAVAALDVPRRLAVDQLATAATLLVAALLVYQPAAMEFWVFLAIALAGAVGDPVRARRLVRAHAAVAAVAFAVAFVVAKIAVHVVGSSAPNPARLGLTHHPVGKLGWFLHGPLYWSLNLFKLAPSPWLAAVVAVVAAGGIVLGLRQRRSPMRLLLVTGLALVPLSFLPNLVVAENSPTYRVLPALSSLIALYACFGAIGIWLALRDRVRPRVGRATLVAAERGALALAACVVATGAVTAAGHVTSLFVLPQSTELRLIRSQVAALPAGVSRIGFVETPYFDSMSSFVAVDEFGVPSSGRPWSLEPAVLLILREEGRLPPPGQRPAVDMLPWDTTTLPTDEPVIDVRTTLAGLR